MFVVLLYHVIRYVNHYIHLQISVPKKKKSRKPHSNCMILVRFNQDSSFRSVTSIFSPKSCYFKQNINWRKIYTIYTKKL